MRRMPPSPQRRNTAYLNCKVSRIGPLDRRLDARTPGPLAGLAIDLDGSLKRRFRPEDLGAAYLDEPLTWLRRLNEER